MTAVALSEARFGGYRVVELLGEGPLFTISKAVSETSSRTVAIKSLRPEVASSFADQLEREARILADLVHPNIALLLDVGRTKPGRPYLVLEYVDGPSLKTVLAKRRRLPIATALAIAYGVAAALAEAHVRGVVHRDVTPSNLVLGHNGVVKVIDFGIAQRTRMVSISDAYGEGVTPSGRPVQEPLKDAFGTPAYMSPEQILGDFVDGRSDIFSLGVVLYEMLSGSRPFEATGQRIRRDAPPPLGKVIPGIPRHVERIVGRMLEKSPHARDASAEIVRERLEGALRAITREAPSVLIADTLADLGFCPRPSRIADHEGTRREPVRVRSAVAALSVVLAIFCVTAAILQRGQLRASATAPAVGPTGGLRVNADPWAVVKVDGHEVETTPFATPISLPPGPHWVTLSHPDARDVEREITITKGETVWLEVKMEPLTDAGAP